MWVKYYALFIKSVMSFMYGDSKSLDGICVLWAGREDYKCCGTSLVWRVSEGDAVSMQEACVLES